MSANESILLNLPGIKSVYTFCLFINKTLLLHYVKPMILNLYVKLI